MDCKNCHNLVQHYAPSEYGWYCHHWAYDLVEKIDVQPLIGKVPPISGFAPDWCPLNTGEVVIRFRIPKE